MNGSTGLNDDLAPASIRWVARGMTGLFFGTGTLALWTILVCQFVPSTLGFRIAATASVFVGVIYAMWTYVDPAYARNTPERAARLTRAPFLADPLARAFYLGVFMALLTFEATIGSGLEIWTRAVGHPSAMVLHLGAYHHSSRSSCSGFDVAEAPFKLHRFVCVDIPDGEAPPEGAPLYVRGPASPVGIDVRLFRIADARGFAPSPSQR